MIMHDDMATQHDEEIILSIYILTFNRNVSLKKIVEQVSLQVEQIVQAKVEIIISDNSQEINSHILKEFPNVNYYHNNGNLGLRGSLLKAVERVNGKFIWFLSDDNLILPEALQTVLFNLNIMRKNNSAVAAINRISHLNGIELKNGDFATPNCVSFDDRFFIRASFFISALIFQTETLKATQSTLPLISETYPQTSLMWDIATSLTVRKIHLIHEKLIIDRIGEKYYKLERLNLVGLSEYVKLFSDYLKVSQNKKSLRDESMESYLIEFMNKSLPEKIVRLGAKSVYFSRFSLSLRSKYLRDYLALTLSKNLNLQNRFLCLIIIALLLFPFGFLVLFMVPKTNEKLSNLSYSEMVKMEERRSGHIKSGLSASDYSSEKVISNLILPYWRRFLDLRVFLVNLNAFMSGYMFHMDTMGVFLNDYDSHDAHSKPAFSGRNVLSLDIFVTLRGLSLGLGREIQFAYDINIHAQQGSFETVRLNGRRFNCGSVGGFMRASNYQYDKSLVV